MDSAFEYFRKGYDWQTLLTLVSWEVVLLFLDTF